MPPLSQNRDTTTTAVTGNGRINATKLFVMGLVYKRPVNWLRETAMKDLAI